MAATHAHFHVTIEETPGRAVIAGVGELDLASVDELADVVREHLAAGPVLIDLAHVSFMDSSGVRMLDALVREASRDGSPALAISSVLQAQVVQVLRLTGMLDALPLEDPSAPDGPGR